MSLIRLKDTKGNILFLNPTRVLLVASGASNGSPVIGESAIVLDNGMTLAIEGTPEEVNSVLDGKKIVNPAGPAKIISFEGSE